MSILVGSARIDENGKASGGTAGDQTGNEVSTQTWYSKPWDFMAIHPDEAVRELHAAAVEAACANDEIGYDQNQRNTLNTQAKKVDYDLAKITTACECDCSSLQNVAAIAAGAVTADSYGSNGWTTSTMQAKLKAAGYKIVTDSTILKSSAYCVRGAVYVKEGSHTVCGLNNGSKYKTTLEKAGITADEGSKTVDEVAQEVIAGKWGNGTARKTALEAAGYDYDTVQAKVNELLKSSSSGSTATKTSSSSGSSAKSTAPTFKVGTVYTTQVDNLNVRKGAGTNYAKVTYANLTANGKANANSSGQLKKGTKVTCKAVKTVGDDIWIQIPSGWIAAYYGGKAYVA